MHKFVKVLSAAVLVLLTANTTVIHAEEPLPGEIGEPPIKDPCRYYPFKNEGDHRFPSGCVAHPAIAIREVILEEDEEEYEKPVIPSGWVMAAIDGYWVGCLPPGGELYLPDLPGVRGYTFGSGEIEAYPGWTIPVYDSVWVYPVY